MALIGNGLVRHVPFRPPFKTAVRIPIHEACAVIDGGLNLVAPVRIFAATGHKRIARTDLAAVGTEAFTGGGKVLQLGEVGILGGGGLAVHGEGILEFWFSGCLK